MNLFIPGPAGLVLSMVSLLVLWHAMWRSLRDDPQRGRIPIAPVTSGGGFSDLILFPIFVSILWPLALLLAVWIHGVRLVRLGRLSWPIPRSSTQETNLAVRHEETI